MDLDEVRRFFDSEAPTWDQTSQHDEKIIDQIFYWAGIHPGMKVLDVACGTGVLFEDYRRHGIRDLTAVDLSPEMVHRARKKWPGIRIFCGDAAHEEFPERYDAIMIYNAFPHFGEPECLISHLSQFLAPDGTLTVAHGMSRAALLAHHAGKASSVSLELPEARVLGELFSRYLRVERMISTAAMYQVTGRKA